MKKMTKILSLVLALAMVLGMTAFAGTPSKILYQYTFDDAKNEDGTYDIAKFKANRTATAKRAGVTLSPADAFTEGAGEYYYFNGADPKIEVVDGKPYIVKAVASNEAHLSYKFDEAWDRDPDNGKTVVVLTNVIPVSATSVQYQFMVPVETAKLKDETNTSENHTGYKINEDGSLVLVEVTDQHAFGFNKTAWGGASGYNGEATAPWVANEPQQIGFMVVSKNLYGSKAAYLASYNIIGNTSSYPTGINTIEGTNLAYEDATYSWYAEQLTGVVFGSDKTNSVYLGETVVFEISLDKADIRLAQTEYTDVKVEDKKLELIWEQPVLKTHYNKRGSLTDSVTDYASRYVVNDGTKDLVYGTDYTVDYDTKIDGDTVKGVVTFNLNTMGYSETYTVSIAKGQQASYGRETNKEAQFATFVTEKAPAFDISISAAEGLSANGAAVTADAMAGKTVCFTANAENVTGRALNGTIIIGIYNAAGNLVKVAAADKAFADAGNASFAASFKMEEGYTAKAFVKGTASEKVFGN